jgi:hypothetical protein
MPFTIDTIEESLFLSSKLGGDNFRSQDSRSDAPSPKSDPEKKAFVAFPGNPNPTFNPKPPFPELIPRGVRA